MVSALVDGSEIRAGEANSLQAKLDAAARSRQRGNTTAVEGQLNAFLNEIDAMVRSGRLSAAQVDRLREEHAVYLVRSGRMCVAGLSTGNVERVAQAFAAVLG